MRRLAILAALALALATGAARAEPARYAIDPEHTSVMFRIDHVGFTRSVGWFGKVGGEIVFDPADPAASRVDARLETGSVATNHDQRDAWIRSDKVLDAAKNPAITFVSRKVAVTGPNRGLVEGVLSMRGVERPVTLDVSFGKAGVSPINRKETIGFSATTTFKRSDFGSTAFIGPLGDEIAVTIEAEGLKTP